MSPHPIHPHKRVPKPQLLSLGLPLSLPSAVGNLLNPIVQIGSSSNSASNQPQKQNTPPKPSPGPSPAPSTSPPSSSSPASPASSPSNGGNSQKGGNGGSSNGGNQSSENGSNGSNGNQGNGNGANDNGNGGEDNNGNDNNGGQSNTNNGNGTPSQSGAGGSTGNSGSQGSGGQSQPSSNNPISGGNPSSSSSSGTTSGATSSSSSSNVPNNSNGGATNSSEPASPSGSPPRGEISSPNGSGNSALLQSGNAASGNNNPSKPGQSQPSTGSGSGNSPNDPSNAFNTVGGNGSSPLGGATMSTNSPAVTNGPTSSGATGSKSHAGGIAAGIAVSLIAVALIACILFFLRRRHQRKQADRRVTWITGFVDDGQVPDMVERSSIRSSWGTPFERLTSWARTSNDDPFAYDASHNTPPALPLPVHPPLDVGRPDSANPEIPENPFSDVSANAPGPLHSYQVPSTLPIRLSLISAGSCQDPFDDVNRTAGPISNSDSGQTTTELNGNTTGHGPSQMDFPMPPSTPASVKSGIAIGSPSDLGPHKELSATPSMAFSFPDSPISPTFASPDTASYPHRVSVKHDFRASQARSDEVHLEKGEEVSVVSVYEDGWAFIQKEKDNERGLVPLNCLDL